MRISYIFEMWKFQIFNTADLHDQQFESQPFYPELNLRMSFKFSFSFRRVGGGAARWMSCKFQVKGTNTVT